MTKKPTPPPEAPPAMDPAPTLPASGGAWVRLADGTLVPEAEAPVQDPLKEA